MYDNLVFLVVLIVLAILSGRRGGAAAAVDAGSVRMKIQVVGKWSSDCVDSLLLP